MRVSWGSHATQPSYLSEAIEVLFVQDLPRITVRVLLVMAVLLVSELAGAAVERSLRCSGHRAHGGNTLPQSSRNLPAWKRAPRVCSSSQAVV